LRVRFNYRGGGNRDGSGPGVLREGDQGRKFRGGRDMILSGKG